MATVNIAGLDKALVLATLHNHTRAIGMGLLHDLHRDMTIAEARQFVERGTDDVGNSRTEFGGRSLQFDYVCGRPLKVDITGDEFDPWLFDRDAGEGQAARAIAQVRAEMAANAAA